MSWLSESVETIKGLSKPSHGKLLAEFPRLSPQHVPAGSALLFYGWPGNKFTERIGTNKYGWPYNPPPFHAALMMRDGVFHNVGRFKTDRLLSTVLRSTWRIDCMTPLSFIENTVRYDAAKVARLMQVAELDTSVPKFGLDFTDYGVMNFIHFGFSFIRHGKELVCSGNVDKLWGDVGETASEKDVHHVAPWDILDHGMKNPDDYQLRTVHVGRDFAPGIVGK